MEETGLKIIGLEFVDLQINPDLYVEESHSMILIPLPTHSPEDWVSPSFFPHFNKWHNKQPSCKISKLRFWFLLSSLCFLIPIKPLSPIGST